MTRRRDSCDCGRGRWIATRVLNEDDDCLPRCDDLEGEQGIAMEPKGTIFLALLVVLIISDTNNSG